MHFWSSGLLSIWHPMWEFFISRNFLKYILINTRLLIDHLYMSFLNTAFFVREKMFGSFFCVISQNLMTSSKLVITESDDEDAKTCHVWFRLLAFRWSCNCTHASIFMLWHTCDPFCCYRCDFDPSLSFVLHITAHMIRMLRISPRCVAPHGTSRQFPVIIIIILCLLNPSRISHWRSIGFDY